MADPQPQRILVIKLSALGDFVLSIGSFQAIRARHPYQDRITLVTTKPYTRLAEMSGCFDDIWLDTRPPWWRIGQWLAFRHRLNTAKFDRVYDLQRSERSAWYFRLLATPKPEWVGTVPGCSHYYEKPADKVMHIAEREAAQLALAGIGPVEAPDLSFVQADVDRFDLPKTFALLIPGGAAHRPAKRWPRDKYAALAKTLAARGLTPVLLGSEAEAPVLSEIAGLCPQALNLCGKTGLADLAVLARRAALAVGNDTGPMHMIAAAGCPSLALFSGESDPAKVSPRGRAVTTLRKPSLDDLPIEDVVAALEPIIGKANDPTS